MCDFMKDRKPKLFDNKGTKFNDALLRKKNINKYLNCKLNLVCF